MKKIVVPALLFILSALTTIIFIQAGVAAFFIGTGIIASTFLRNRGKATLQNASPSYVWGYRSGLALVVAPLIAFIVVVAGMAGIFQ